MLKFSNCLSNLSENSVGWALNEWSFIPLNGDFLAGQEKAPALSNWKQFQERRPSEAERKQWFDVERFHAAGIILGKISGLVMIDIDDSQTAELFRHAMPDLTQTFTVYSGNRNLPHYYYAIDGRFAVPNIRTKQIELRSDGAYVVAPNVMIGGKVWRVTNPAQPRNLTESDLRRLEAFIQVITQKTPQNAITPDLRALDAPSLTRSKLVNRYIQLANQIGRNNALFNCGRYARDRGWTAGQVAEALTAVHVNHPAPTPNHETPASRQREAERTIASVYQCPARPIPLIERAKQLPNAVREALLQRKDGFLARVLDALLLTGVRVGEWLNTSQIIDVLGKVGIGRNTIYQALRMTEIFNPQAPTANADKSAEKHIKQCLFDSGTNPIKNKRGRPSLYFQMPSFDRLCQWLGVKNRGSDTLTIADVQTPTAYRRALYQAHIKRAPGAYTRQWQSQRLGICGRTCRRYDRQCGISVYPRYHEQPILWDTLEGVINEDRTIGGRFMMDETGRRYPEDRLLAKRLLGQGRRLSLMVQGANYYHIETRPSSTQATDERVAPLAILPNVAPNLNHAKRVIVGIPQPALSAHLTAPKTPKSKRHKRPSHAPDRMAIAKMAERLYQTLRAINPDQSITKQTAKAWTKTYGVRSVEKALGVLKTRQNIVKNPAGFVRILLNANRTVVLKKNDSTFQNGVSKADSRAGLGGFLGSKFASIFANYDDLLAVVNE